VVVEDFKETYLPEENHDKFKFEIEGNQAEILTRIITAT
jgi:hypothetical protein